MVYLIRLIRRLRPVFSTFYRSTSALAAPKNWLEILRLFDKKFRIAIGRALFLEANSGTKTMWRSFFMAVGIFCCILGAEFLLVDHVVLRSAKKPEENPGLVRQIGFAANRNRVQQQKIYVPKDWMPWTLMAGGTIVLIYSFRPKS